MDMPIEYPLLREKVAENVKKLMEDYEQEIDDAYSRIEPSEDNKKKAMLAVTFKNEMGNTKKGFEVKTTITFVGTRTKDSITCIIDPNQPELPLGDQSGEQDAT